MNNNIFALRSRCLSLVIDKAASISHYCGAAWLFCLKGKILKLQGSTQLESEALLLSQIKASGAGADLYLSLPPNALIKDSNALVKSATDAGIVNILYPRIPAHFRFSDNHKTNFLSNNINVIAINNALMDLGTVITMQTNEQKKRPWISCITCADLSGRKADFSTFDGDIEAINYIKRLVGNMEFVAEEPGCLPFNVSNTKNNANQAVQHHTVNSLLDVKKLLAHACEHKMTCGLIIVHTDLAKEMIVSGLVDEMIYYLCLHQTELENTQPINLLNNDWKISSSYHFSKGIRFNARPESDMTKQQFNSEHRLYLN
ncbi:hypothetical protein [Paraglaciecola sp. T6c]|uniref:hypothetical protein n=1 Tax=Pseudoalteromonas atlantica (strain T6c / ATCC BAA-1087) TaxID=3042615 RepID=UPI0005A25850|nr:hypothetical protein [Paraglaciecola sp. T6c]